MREHQLGIFGWPVGHSLSPVMHKAAGKAIGVAIRYDLFEVEPAEFEKVVRAQCEGGLQGFNVTVPHKQAALALVDTLTDEAQQIGAVNTVVCDSDGTLHGHNTDARGLVRSLEESGLSLQEQRVVVLGAGGAARAAIVGLAHAGASAITVLARDEHKANVLVEALRLDGTCVIQTGTLTSTDPPYSRDSLESFPSCDLLVQATSATLTGNPHADAFADGLPMMCLPAHATVIDLVYKPRITAVIKQARDHGLRTVDGLGMLIHQGAIAFEHWTQKPAPIAAMRNAVEDAIGG